MELDPTNLVEHCVLEVFPTDFAQILVAPEFTVGIEVLCRGRHWRLSLERCPDFFVRIPMPSLLHRLQVGPYRLLLHFLNHVGWDREQALFVVEHLVRVELELADERPVVV